MYLGPNQEGHAKGAASPGTSWQHWGGQRHSRVRALLLGLGQLSAAQDVDLQLLLRRLVAERELHTAAHGRAAQLRLAVQAHQAAAQLRGGGTRSGGAAEVTPTPNSPQPCTVEELRLETEELVVSRLRGTQPFCGDSCPGEP